MTTNKAIVPIALPGIHEKFYQYFKDITANKTNLKVLDVGAGHGALCQEMYNDGYDVAACDLFPEYFYFDKIPCKKADLTKPLPFADNSFDVIIAVEVMEHILDHEVFFSECNRILKPNGQVLISTPNILSLKSRFRFLFSGFFYTFKPLELQNNDGLQHVASLTLDQYNYVAIRNGFTVATVNFDKRQSTSRWLLFMYPFLWLHALLKAINPKVHNTYDLLTARILFLGFTTKKTLV
jgi:SAM-dependent methyltransferase